MIERNPLKLCVKFLSLIALFFLMSCDSKKNGALPVTSSDFTCNYSIQSKGARLFGMDILNEPVGGSYSDNFTKLKNLHGNFQTLHLTWTAIETTAGSGATSGTLVDPEGGALAIFSGLANTDGIKLALTIRPVDATGKTVPSDLASVRFNNANVIDRFKKVIDFVLTKIDQDNLTAIMIGNEIDNYNPATDTNFWTDYAAFLFAIKTYVNTTYPGLDIGFTSTYEGFTSSTKTTPDGWNAQSVMQALAGNVNVVGITYYPLNANFTMKSPSIVSTDFTNIVTTVPSSKPIHIQEIGYATSSSTDSSIALQQQFFCEVFKAWDENSSRITQLAALRMNDITRADAEAMAVPYGNSSEAFIEYLRTLGINNSEGSAKSTFSLIKTELSKRGF